jgi:hypothetical protein
MECDMDRFCTVTPAMVSYQPEQRFWGSENCGYNEFNKWDNSKLIKNVKFCFVCIVTRASTISISSISFTHTQEARHQLPSSGDKLKYSWHRQSRYVRTNGSVCSRARLQCASKYGTNRTSQRTSRVCTYIYIYIYISNIHHKNVSDKIVDFKIRIPADVAVSARKILKDRNLKLHHAKG